ncbi:PP2C family protein-serine/threonine phosphatase [Bacillus tianshenii]|nr:PP2C family protein-serine/threonine phosphatase [Bacillus tianshenii]
MSAKQLNSKQDQEAGMTKPLEREINLARNIQMTLLNGQTPSLDSGEVKGVSIPARLIGGDYYDFYPLLNGKMRIVIGDVMGKGIPAAMLMILTRGAFRSAAESTIGPGETLTAMNNAICNDLRALKSFVTVFCADWDPKTNTLTYANAGHNLPLIFQGKTIQELPKLTGVMLGGLPNQQYTAKEIHLKEKDFVFFYTDGIVEAQNETGIQYQKDRLIQILLEHKEENVEQIEKAVIDSINQFTEGVTQKDDITMVTLKICNKQLKISSYNSPIIT